MPNILRTIQDLIKGCLSPGADAPPLPTILEGLATRLTGWLSAEPDPSPDGFERWLGGLRSAAGDDETRETGGFFEKITEVREALRGAELGGGVRGVEDR